MGVLVLRVPAAEIESASDWLFQLGATAIEEREGDDDASLIAGFTSDTAALDARSLLQERWSCRLEDTGDERRWRDAWLDHLEPVAVAGFTIHAPWHDPAALPVDQERISIDPGRAFGSGHHPTTRLALGAMRRHVRDGARVLDAGCGTGILAIAAAQLGAASVVGVDLDHDILAVAAANREANPRSERIELTEAPLSDLDNTFDVVVANIVIGDLRPLMPDLIDRVEATAGLVIVTGFLDDQLESVLVGLDATVVDHDEADGWASMTLR